jgi:hypothetical protein
MDRDAASAPLPYDPTALAEVVPPYEWPLVRKVGLVGIGLLAGAAVLGLAATAIGAGPEWFGNGARLLLVLVGSITVGAAVSMRPGLWPAWALGGVGGALAVVGTPAHWDSFRLLFLVLAAFSAAAAGLLAAPAKYRLPVFSAVVVFHFVGIFFATTTPPATPWVTEQAYVRVYNPYLQFLYLRNAYHFYSPQPGPASLLVFQLTTYELRPKVGSDGKPGMETLADIRALESDERAKRIQKTQWIVLPRRPADVKDPLGLSYYRYLALTEQVARATPALRANTFEAKEMRQRRELVSLAIPPHPSDPLDIQYQLLQPEVARYVVPSYASHVIIENTPDKDVAARTTVKMYRVQHNTLPIEEFYNWRKSDGVGTPPYHPTTYRPYFLGEFDARGNMVNPQDPMLYWLVPIIPRPGNLPTDPTKRDFLDYLSFHALGPESLGPNTTVDELGDPKFKDRVFDWAQLR